MSAVTTAAPSPLALAPKATPVAPVALAPKSIAVAPVSRERADRSVPVIARFAPGVELRLPEALSRSIDVWLQAVETGREERMAQSYGGPQTLPVVWSAIGLSPTGVSAKRLRLIQVEQIDADRDFKGAAAQISLLTELADAGGVRCIRSAQAWRNLASPDAPARWQIVRERALAVAGAACQGRG
jgi:hypothetical protein